jgi:hypothetical protein
VSSAVVERPAAAPTEPAWVILDAGPLFADTPNHGVEIRGHGNDQYGAIRRGGVRPAPPNLVVLPPVDDLD